MVGAEDGLCCLPALRPASHTEASGRSASVCTPATDDERAHLDEPLLVGCKRGDPNGNSMVVTHRLDIDLWYDPASPLLGPYRTEQIVIHPWVRGKQSQEWKGPASERLKLQPSGFPPLSLGFSLHWGMRVSGFPAKFVPADGCNCDLMPPGPRSGECPGLRDGLGGSLSSQALCSPSIWSPKE